MWKALFGMQGTLCPLGEIKCKYKELLYKAKDSKWWESQKAYKPNAIVLLLAFKEKYFYNW